MASRAVLKVKQERSEDSDSGSLGVRPPIEPSEEPLNRRSPNFYFKDGDLSLRVGANNELYRIHSYLFQQESEKARALLRDCASNNPAISDNIEDLNVGSFPDIKVKELESFLKLLYTPALREPTIETRSQWTHVLKLSTMWDFAFFRTFAIGRLFSMTTAIQRLLLAHEYGVDEWLHDAYLDVCEEPALPNDKDIEKMGPALFVKIARGREKLAGNEDSRADKLKIIEDIFTLQPPVDDGPSQPLPHKPSVSRPDSNAPASKRKRSTPTLADRDGDYIDSVGQPIKKVKTAGQKGQSQVTLSPVLDDPSPSPIALRFTPMFKSTANQRGLTVAYRTRFTGTPVHPHWVAECIVDGEVKGVGEAVLKQPAVEEATRKAYHAMGWIAHRRSGLSSRQSPSTLPPTTAYLLLLNFTAQQHGVACKYSQELIEPTHPPLYSVKCIVEGVVRGESQAYNKQHAKELAAEQAWFHLGWNEY